MEMLGRRKLHMRMLIILPLVLLMVLVLIPVATGDPVEQKRQEARDTESEIKAFENELEDKVELYNYYVYKEEEVQGQIEDNKVAVAEAEEELDRKQKRLRERVRTMWINGGRTNDFLQVALNAKSIGDFLTAVDFCTKISANDAQLVAEVKAAREQLIAKRQELEVQEDEVVSLRQNAAAEKSDIENRVAAKKDYLADVNQDIERLIAARIVAPSSSSPSSPGRRSSPGVVVPNNPRGDSTPPGPANGGVVGVAYAQLGKPYQYAGAGPDVFDCSGLVQYCYRVGAGKSIPHNSYAIWTSYPSVSVSDLQPGDVLIFRGGGHSGIYVGGGQYIHAPQTGDVVRVADLSSRRNFCGAVRP